MGLYLGFFLFDSKKRNIDGHLACGIFDVFADFLPKMFILWPASASFRAFVWHKHGTFGPNCEQYQSKTTTKNGHKSLYLVAKPWEGARGSAYFEGPARAAARLTT